MIPIPGDTTTSSSAAAAAAAAARPEPLPFPVDDTATATTAMLHEQQQPYPHAHANEDADEGPDSPHAFGIEKGFWKVSHAPPTPNPEKLQTHHPPQIHSAAQELLKFAAIYQSGPSSEPGADRRLPKEIDMLSMMQLSWSVLHAVGDINSHNQRLHGLAGRAPGGRCEKRAAKKRRRVCFLRTVVFAYLGGG